MSSSSLYVFVDFGVSFEWISLDELRRQLTHGGRQACVQRPIFVFSFDKFRDGGITAVPSCDNCGFVGPNDGFFPGSLVIGGMASSPKPNSVSPLLNVGGN